MSNTVFSSDRKITTSYKLSRRPSHKPPISHHKYDDFQTAFIFNCIISDFRCVRLLGHHVPTPCDLQKKGSSFSSVFSDPGPIVSFICFTANGNIIPHSIIQRVADSYNVYLRTGCFCNMGGCIEGLLLSDQDIRLMYKDGNIMIWCKLSVNLRWICCRTCMW